MDESIASDEYLEDQDLSKSWEYFSSFISEREWEKRKKAIEENISIHFRDDEPFSVPLTEGTALKSGKDVFTWYLYLLYAQLFEPHKYEYYQGARVLPIFKRIGADLDLLKSIDGVSKKIRDLLWKRSSEADAIIFEILAALVWTRNQWKVRFVPESGTGKTPDFYASKGDDTWQIECKRLMKDSDYSIRETAKRRKMAFYVSKMLLERNMLLDIVFHVELETLPDSFLFDMLEEKLKFITKPCSIISNATVDISVSFVDIPKIEQHLQKYSVKYPSPQMAHLIAGRPVDNHGFTSGCVGKFGRYGEGKANNLYITDIGRAYGIFWRCDAPEAIFAKARNIKSQLFSAMQQFNVESKALIHIGIETYDGPEVEKQRFEKISDTIMEINPKESNLRWIFCHFFQSYSPPPPNDVWVFDETVSVITAYEQNQPPLVAHFLVVPEDFDTASNMSHWERPLPGS